MAMKRLISAGMPTSKTERPALYTFGSSGGQTRLVSIQVYMSVSSYELSYLSLPARLAKNSAMNHY
jgi:hypothetical protein